MKKNIVMGCKGCLIFIDYPALAFPSFSTITGVLNSAVLLAIHWLTLPIPMPSSRMLIRLVIMRWQTCFIILQQT